MAIGFVASALIFSVILGKAGRRNATKDTPYECGMLPEARLAGALQREVLPGGDVVHPVRHRDCVHVPVGGGLPAVRVRRPGPFLQRTEIFWSMLSFVFILTVGYVYAIMKGALDWKK